MRNGEIIEATAELETLLDEYEKAKSALEKAEERLKAAEEAISNAIGQASGVVGSSGRKAVIVETTRASTTWKTVAMAAGASAELIAANTKVSPLRQFKYTYAIQKITD